MAFTDAVWAIKVAEPSVKRTLDAMVLKVRRFIGDNLQREGDSASIVQFAG